MAGSLIWVTIGLGAIYVGSELLDARLAGWSALAERYANSASPDAKWQRLGFLQLEWMRDGIIHRGVYGRGKFLPMAFWARIWEMVCPALRLAITHQGIYIRRQRWHFRHPSLLIPWSALDGLEPLDAAEFMAAHGTLPPRVGAALDARMPRAIRGALDRTVGPLVRLDLKQPELQLFLLASDLGDISRYFRPTPAADVAPQSISEHEPRRVLHVRAH